MGKTSKAGVRGKGIDGEAALASLAGPMRAIKERDLAHGALDIDAAAGAAIAVCKRIDDASTKLRASLQSIPEAIFPHAFLAQLPTLAAATKTAAQAYVQARGSESDAKLPAALVAEATDLEARLQKLCEYHFSDDPELGPLLVSLSPGTSYRDTSGDLVGYARMVLSRLPAVKDDKKNYRAEDPKRALELAQQIDEALASVQTPAVRKLRDTAIRAFTLLLPAYEEVRATGLYIERHDPERFAHWPALYAAGRPRVGRPKKKAATTAAGATPKT